MTTATELDDAIITTADIAGRWRVSAQTVARWCTEGVTAPDGTRLRLKRTKVGGVARYFRRDWEAFLSALNPDQEAAVAEARGQAGAARAATRRVRRQLGE